jgi:hypothetical protein
MGLHDAPTFSQAHPHLALTAAHDVGCRVAFKFQRDAGEVAAETNYVDPSQGARQIDWGDGESKSAIISQIIAATIEEGLIKADETVGTSRKNARYLPFWA